MTVYEFIANQPNTEKVVVCTDYDSYKMTIADLKAADENKYYIVDSWTWESDIDTWFFAVDIDYNGQPDKINSEYLILDIHDMREDL